jgi:hypothetical protein
MAKIIYDIVQRFEVENGIPRLISTNIQIIEGSEDLMSIACNWVETHSPQLQKQIKQQYVGFKEKKEKRYSLVLTEKRDGLQVSHPRIAALETAVFDGLFPYCHQIPRISRLV